MRKSRILATVLCAAAVSGSAVALAAPSAGAARDPWKALLARIPADGSFSKQVILNDYEAAREELSLEQSKDRLRDLSALELEAGVAAPELLRASGDGDPLDDELGIRYRDVRHDASAGLPPDDLTILEASIDSDRVQSAVEDDETWSDLLETEEHAGEEFYSWGPRKVQAKRVTPLRPLGIGGNLAIDPPFATWSDSAASIEASIDAAAGDVDSLADDRDITAVLDAVRTAGAYSAFLSTALVAPGADTGGPESLAPYEAVATGVGFEHFEHVMLVALAYEDAATARTQADRLRAIADGGTSVTGAPWNELVSVRDLTTKGRVVLGTFASEQPGLWLDLVFRRDSLLATA